MKKYIIVIFFNSIITVISAQNVTLEWQKLDTSNMSLVSELNTLVLDNQNNIYATGYKSSLTIEDEAIVLKYGNSGSLIWNDMYGGQPAGWNYNRNEGKIIKLSLTGNIIVGGNTRLNSDEFQIRSYNSEGILNWNLFSGQIQSAIGAEGSIADFTILPDNNIAVFANLNYKNGLGNTFSTFKMSSNGQQIWSGTYGANSSHDFGTTIANDTAGIIYMTGGVFNMDNSSYDFTTLNIHPNGVNDWISRFNHSSGSNDFSLDMVVDDQQNQFITGMSNISNGQTDINTIMQNSFGTRLWNKKYSGSAGLSDTAVEIITDNLQNSYILGTTLEDTLNTTLSTATVIKYDKSGNIDWINKFIGTEKLGGKGRGFTQDKNGDLYILAEVNSQNNGKNILVTKINTLGNVIWEYEYDGPNNQDDFANDIAIDDQYNVIVVGATNYNSIKKHLSFKLSQVITGIANNNIESSPFKINHWNYQDDKLSLSYSSIEDLKVQFNLYDISGRTITSSEKIIDQSNNGIFEYKLDVPNGIYFYQLINENINLSGKFLLTR